MGYPTLPDLLAAEPDNYTAIHDGLTVLAQTLDDHASHMSTEISSVRWKGQSHNAAVGRAAEEKSSIQRISATARTCANDIASSVPALADQKAAIVWRLVALYTKSFKVSADWTVSDAKIYPAGDEAQQRANEEEKQRRAQDARDESAKLRAESGEFGTIDGRLARSLRSAAQELNQLSPAAAAVSMKDADSIADDLKHGRPLTSTQLAELKASTNLTTQQQKDLVDGRNVDLPSNRYAYLRELMRNFDSTSPSELDHLGDGLDPGTRTTVQSSMANAMQLMGSPSITDAATGAHGGMDSLPAGVRNALQMSPGGLVPGISHYDVKTGRTVLDAAPRTQLTNYRDLKSLDDILGKGDPALRVNTDLDRGMLKQASELAHLGSVDSALSDETGRPVSPHELNSAIGSMLSRAGTDHDAVTSFLTGNGMAGTVTPGNQYDVTSHFMGLVTHQFDLDPTTHMLAPDEKGVSSMFDWIGKSAAAPGHQGDLGALAANAYGHLLADNSDQLGLDIYQGTRADHPNLGSINPELTQTMAKNVIPYLGAFNGMHGTGVHDGVSQQYGFDNITHMQGMIQVLDSDPISAAAINHAGSAWENYATAMYGAHGDSSYAAAAGRFHQMFADADQTEIKGLTDEHNWDQVRAYTMKDADWDSAQAIVKGGLGFLPGGGFAGDLIDAVNPTAKIDALGIPGNPWDHQGTDLTDAIDRAFTSYNNSTQGLYQSYDLAHGYASTHGGFQADSRWAPFLDHGDPTRLNWDKVTQDSQRFRDLVRGLVPMDAWNDKPSGYDSGAYSGANIDPTVLPAPGNDPTNQPGSTRPRHP